MTDPAAPPNHPSDTSASTPPRGSTGEGLPGTRGAATADGVGGRSVRMRRFALILVSCVAALSLLVGTGILAAGRAGSVVVQVTERGGGGDNVRIRVPAAFGHLALLCMPDRAFCWSQRDRVFRHREMRALAGELERIPDGTVLVQVDSPQETVKISREHGTLLIHVDSDDENVRVEVPIKLAGAFLKRVDRVARVG